MKLKKEKREKEQTAGKEKEKHKKEGRKEGRKERNVRRFVALFPESLTRKRRSKGFCR